VRKAILSGRLRRYFRYIDKKTEEMFSLFREYEQKYQNMTRGNYMIDFKGFNIIEHACIRCERAMKMKFYGIPDLFKVKYIMH
jgi:hypothetical protein